MVGSGSAGSIVAGRLTEAPGVSVLLIEAGGPASVITDMLAESWNGMIGDHDWGYTTTPQRHAGFAFRNREIIYPRGRVLGGSSTTNFAIYNRGNRHDYDNWANYYGLGDWSYEAVLPYFLRTENNTNMGYVQDNRRYHSTSGPMPITSPPKPDPILLRYMSAWNRQGVPYTDFNGPNQYGTSECWPCVLVACNIVSPHHSTHPAECHQQQLDAGLHLEHLHLAGHPPRQSSCPHSGAGDSRVVATIDHHWP